MTTSQDDLVIGVAGHIDHGKTALVLALTGVDTDRLPEEKTRGITIELGFAPWRLDDGRRAAVVDMPGHEKFVRTMISGAGGIDAMLLVVAANEGVMPQTREHLAIAGLVGVRAGVCALSKADLASDELMELAKEEVTEVLRGTVLDGAAVVPVSAHAGTGLERLREALGAVTVTARDANGPVVLPIDRVFVRRGFGVVVTGTLVGGTVRVGDGLGVGPVGIAQEVLDVRVRGLQVHGHTVTEARAGTRLAVNLAGVELSEVPRGAWLFARGAVCVSRSFDVRVSTLAETRRALGRRTKLEVAVGATHALATVSLLEGDTLEPGETTLARVTTDRALVVRPGERMVLRGPPSLAGIGSTVGGVEVVRPEAERVRKRSVALDRARRASEGGLAARAVVELMAVGIQGMTPTMLRARVGGSGASMTELGGVMVTVERVVGAEAMAMLEANVLEALSAHHGKHPGERGMDRRGLSGTGDDAVVDVALGRLGTAGKITRDGDVIARKGWRAQGMEDVRYIAETRTVMVRAGLSAPRVEEVMTETGGTREAIEAALKRLVDRGEVVRVSGELYVEAGALGMLEAKLVAWLDTHGTIDAQGYKDLTGLTRKYVIPYAEYFDAKKVTLRIGDRRKLRGR